MGQRAIAAIGVGAALLALPGPAGAANFTVNSTKDGIDAGVTDGVCATANGKCTLRAAIAQANETTGDDEIKVPRGTFELKRPPAPEGKIESNQEGDLQVTEEVRIDGRGRRKTVIEQTVGDRVLRNFGGGVFSPVTLSDLAITGGWERGPDPIARGGGIYNAGALLLEGVAVRDNRVRGPEQSFGGGIYQHDGVLLIGNSVIRDNRVRHEDSFAGGGGIYAQGGSVAIQLSRVSGNSVAVADDPFRGKTGGVFVAGNATISDTTIAGNRSAGGAGGLYVGDELDLRTSTISGNRGFEGGGLYTVGPATIENTTISGNTAKRQGSAIYRGTTINDTLTLTHVTIARNRARDGHAAFEAATDVADGSLVFRASIMANPGPECIAADSDLMSFGYNVWADQCGPFNDVVANPKLRELADNGGPTQTHAIPLSSPAFQLVTQDCPPPMFDQRGIQRVPDACDSGAFEIDG